MIPSYFRELDFRIDPGVTFEFQVDAVAFVTCVD
jgi:hypothetical protein